LKVSHTDVAFRGCYNAELAAWLLRQRIDENNGQDYWTRVANYHSKTKKYNDIYKKSLFRLLYGGEIGFKEIVIKNWQLPTNN
jgi:hypothetical protein